MIPTKDLPYFLQINNINRLLYKLGKIKLNMGKSGPAFTCIKAKSVLNVQRRVNEGSDMPVLLKCLNIITS